MVLPSHRFPLPRRRRGNGIAGVSLTLAGWCLVLLGFVFVAAAVLLYSSSRARSRHHHEEGDLQILPGSDAPRVTIFSAPLPPPDGSPERQELAVRSWLALPGNVSVVLLGAHPSALALAGLLGRRVTVEPAVDSSFAGTPFFHSMVARAQAADSDICILVDASIVLLPEIVTLLTNLSKIDRDWFLVSTSRNISDFPHYLADNGKQWVQADGEEVSFKKLQEIPADKWAEDRSDRGLIVAWNNPSSPLLAGVLPSFQYGRGVHSCWLTHEVLSSEMRLVFDASSLVLGLYPENFSTKQSMSSSRNASLPDGLWEYTVNRHLAAVYGSYCYQFPRRHPPMLYKVVKHSEDYMLSKIEELTLSNFVIGKEQNVHAEGDSLWSKENICLPGHLPSYSSEPSAAVNVPYSLGKLLQLAADKNRSVVLGVAGASYRDMLMSWVCRLRHLRVTNFVVCALDHETYEFSVLQFSEIHYHQRMSALMTATLEPSAFSK